MDKMIVTDGGRIAEGFTHEKLDCTVRAVALARRMSYRAAHVMLEVAGRKPRHGFKLVSYLNKQSWAKHFYSGKTIRRFLLEHEEGNYIARIRGHAFAVCGGIALDNWDISKRRHIVVEFWEVQYGR